MAQKLERFLILTAFFLTHPALSFARDIFLRLDTGVSGQDVQLVGDLTEWNLYWMPLTEISPGIYETHFPEPWLSEFEYGFSVNGVFRKDPTQPNSTHDPDHGEVSVLKTDFQEDPKLSLKPKQVAWVKQDLTLLDYESLKRVVQILSPPKDFVCTRTVEIYFQDGQDYLDGGSGNVLANISGDDGFPCLVGIFIDPVKNRETEYTLGERSDKYTAFLINEVIPKVESQLNLHGDASDRLLMGASLGGLYALATALKHSDVFGLAAPQSGSYWWNEGEIISTIQSAQTKKLKLHLDMGIFEGQEMLSYGHEAVSSLKKKPSIDLTYKEYPSTHDWSAWTNRLSEILVSFFAP